MIKNRPPKRRPQYEFKVSIYLGSNDIATNADLVGALDAIKQQLELGQYYNDRRNPIIGSRSGKEIGAWTIPSP